MPFLELFRTATFRLAFTYVCLFAASVILLLGFIYWRTAGFMVRQSDETIQAEIIGLAEQYRRRGLEGLRQVVTERSTRTTTSLYLLAGPDGTPIAGNVRGWPETSTPSPRICGIRWARPSLPIASARKAVSASVRRLGS